MTPLDAQLAPVISVLGRGGRVLPVSGDYAASQVACSLPTARRDGANKNNVLSALGHLLSGHATDGLRLGRGVFDDFSASGFVSSGGVWSVASDGGGPGNGQSDHLSTGIASWRPDGLGVLKWSQDNDSFGSWEILTGTTVVASGGVIRVAVPVGSWPTGSRKAIRMVCRVRVPQFYPGSLGVFAGLTLASSNGQASTSIADKQAGFHFDGVQATHGMHQVMVTTGSGTVTTRMAPFAVETFDFAITYSPTYGLHMRSQWADGPGGEYEVADTSALSTQALAFVVAAKSQITTNSVIAAVDYVGYQLLDIA